MKILNSKQSNMDNKLKFADRFKVLLNSDTQKGIDPYVFNDTEQPLVSSGGKNIKLIAPKNSKTPSGNKSKSKGKCLKTKMKAEPTPKAGAKAEVGLSLGSQHLSKQPQRSQQLYHAAQPRQRYIKKLQRLKEKRRSRDHTLQYYPRAGDEISDSESSADELQTYQRHWYSGESERTSARSSRMAQLHGQLQRQLDQLRHDDSDVRSALKRKTRCLLAAAQEDPSAAARLLRGAGGANARPLDGPLLVGGACNAEGCPHASLPCTRHCSRHIMLNTDQLLFEHCTAKFSDNTQCCVPVFDVAHELPLCPEHARKRDNYHRRAQESKPKKARSKKPSSPPAQPAAAAAAPASKPKSSRPKKRKRPPSRGKLEARPQHAATVASQQLTMPVAAAPTTLPLPAALPAHVEPVPLLPDDVHHFANSIMAGGPEDELLHTKTLNNLNALAQPGPLSSLNSLGLDIGSLGLGPGLKVELDDHEVFASLDHATEHDFENVLNNLPADAFNDLFIEGRNGGYEPTREEEEELERAVEAFDKDVRNLERLGQTHGLLEPALLAQLMSDIAS